MIIGIDTNYSGAVAVSEGNKIIDICLYPKKTNKYNALLKEIEIAEKNQDISYFSKRYEKNIKKMGSTLQKQIKADKANIKLNTPRDWEKLYDFYKTYKSAELAIIEKPLMQSNNSTSIQALVAGFATLELHCALLKIFNIPYVVVSNSTLDKYFNYTDCPEDFVQEHMLKNKNNTKGTAKREWRKLESIRIAEENIFNIFDFYIPKGSRKINDNIVEASLYSILSDFK